MLRSADELALASNAFVKCPQDRATVRNWIEAAQRKAGDGGVEQSSFDTRMEAYYDAAFSLALVVLNAQGWKMTSAQGHHEHTLEAACRALGEWLLRKHPALLRG